MSLIRSSTGGVQCPRCDGSGYCEYEGDGHAPMIDRPIHTGECDLKGCHEGWVEEMECSGCGKLLSDWELEECCDRGLDVCRTYGVSGYCKACAWEHSKACKYYSEEPREGLHPLFATLFDSMGLRPRREG